MEEFDCRIVVDGRNWPKRPKLDFGKEGADISAQAVLHGIQQKVQQFEGLRRALKEGNMQMLHIDCIVEFAVGVRLVI